MNLGFIGKLGSGKTFAANYLVEKYRFNQISLATPIKEIMSEYLNIKDKNDPRYRQVAQFIGTDTFRTIDPDVWINYMIKTVNKNPNINYVVDDIRFVNEATKLLSNNWILFYLDCPDEIRIERCKKRDGTFNLNTLNHPSETGVDDIVKEFGIKVHKIDASGSIKDTNDIIDMWMDIFN